MADSAVATSVGERIEPSPQEVQPPPESPFWRRCIGFARSFSAVGLTGALVAFYISLLPSLIPRAWLAQAVFSGITMALGYAIGVALRWFARRAGVRPAWSDRTRRIGWLVLAGFGLAGVLAFTALAATWQNDLRVSLGMPGIAPAFAAVFPVGAVVTLGVILLARAGRSVTRLAVSLGRGLPPMAVHGGSAAVVIAAAVLTFNGTVMGWTVQTLDRVAAVAADDDAGVTAPQWPERSGSADSLVSWDSLGAQGRAFVTGGPSTGELSAFAADRARPPDGDVDVPVRVYAGPEAAPDLADRAELIVAELDRAGAWDREILVIATPTGDGKVSAAAIETIELMHAGDTATAVMQYSSVPSWVTFVTDRNEPLDASRAMFEAVYAAWSERPEADRPRLLVYGESLGSYGGQGAFSGIQDMVTRTDGALWVATPSFTTVMKRLTEARDPNTPARKPVYDQGRHVRWSTDSGAATDLWELGPGWQWPRVAYLQHPSDGVVWWSSDLLLHEPDWLRETGGHDVLPGIRWVPVVTYWLATMDMFMAEEVPAGHGHVYVGEYTDAWAAVAPPADWAGADSAELRRLISEKYADS